ncbi:HdeA/HdeB family chaperone [Pseudomonas sp. NPDC086278]|uniref:HdeA/HdeB family chaperone n=1 Tax=Pseudomonas sp. NPDC086278 TaxID=3390646 RepID=UPI003CFDA784
MTYKALCSIALASLILSSAGGAYAATTPDNMTCQQFLDMTPEAHSPVILWVVSDDTINKEGDSFSKTTVDATVLPKVVELCKKNPTKKITSFKQEIAGFFKKM